MEVSSRVIQHIRPRRDPMCGMHVETNQVAATFTYAGQVYAFCSDECHKTFARFPERYVAFLAHDSQGHCGYNCPSQREKRRTPAVSSEGGIT
jgi:YHS domain-containing protein